MIGTNNEIERSILGAIILEGWAYEVVCNNLKPEIFENTKHQHVYKAIEEVSKKNISIDILTVCQELKNMGKLESIGGGFYVSELTNNVASPANIKEHVAIITQDYLKRALLHHCNVTISKLSERNIDIFEVFEETTNKIKCILDDVTTYNKAFDTFDSMAYDFVQELNDKKSGIIPPSKSTGLKEIDKYGGLNNSDLIYIGARPGMGKTAFMLKMARHCVLIENKPVGFITLEMTSKQLLTRIIASETEINSENIRAGNLTDLEINNIHYKLKNLSENNNILYIDDSVRDFHMIKNKIRQMVKKLKCEEIFVDYLGLIDCDTYQNKQDKLEFMSKEFKMLAKELNVPLIIGSQLSRKIEDRPINDRFPRMSDLRDTGALEQDADQIIFLFRPDYYEVDSITIDGNEINTRGKCFVGYGKNRHGAAETKLVGFKSTTTDFFDLNREEF